MLSQFEDKLLSNVNKNVNILIQFFKIIKMNMLTFYYFMWDLNPRPFALKAMDWAGFARSVRQTIVSVMLYVVIEDIFSFILEFRIWETRIEISD